MDALEHALFVDYLRFRLACWERKGSEFQKFFEEIMSMGRPGFTTVKPWGREGDRTCDGAISQTGTVFAVYAPKQIKIREIEAKMRSDCGGAVAKWDRMREWIFVWSGMPDGLPPALQACLEQLREENPGLDIADWGPERLWRIIEDDLRPFDRARLFGPAPPQIDGPPPTTPAEMQALLSFLADRTDGPPTDESFDLTDLRPKLKKNRLGEEVEGWVRRAMPLAREVEGYVNEHYDEDYSKKVGSRLITRYRQLSVGSGLSGDSIFLGLLEYVSKGRLREESYFWGAVAIVTYYFEICDIFER